ncbi:MAG: hypothetical protein R2748_34120 [Bryobacterales bacterium]
MPTDEAAGPIASLVEAARRRLLTQYGVRDAFWAAAIALRRAGAVVHARLRRVSVVPALALHRRRARLGLSALATLAAGRLPSGADPGPARRRRGPDFDRLVFSHAEAVSAEAAPLQRELAQRAAGHVDVGAAFPFVWPRATWAAGGMLALCLALLGVRLAVQERLDLQAPLAPMLFPSLARTAEQPLEELADPQRKASEQEPLALDRQGETEEPEPEEEKRSDALQVPAGEEQAADAFEMPEVEGLSAGEEIGDEMADNQGDAQEGDQSKAGEKGAETGNEQASNEDSSSGDWSEESNNLLDRLKDAFKNMMDNMSMEPPQTAQGEQGQEQQGQGEQSSEGQQGQAQAEAGAQASDAQMEGGEPGEGEPQQTAQGQGSSDTNEAGNQGEAASASGAAEGSKELADALAEQKAAMDALEEFYMKRAEEIQGEIMVETTETEQTAETPYRNVAGRHADRGGAVSRDEIPLAYQRYIENYFRNLRAKDQD